MASSTSSLPAPASRPASPSLDTLVTHLLAAKRSLTSTTHVSCANALITSSRTALEQQTILSARTTFVRRGCQAQAKSLREIHAHASRTHAKARSHIKAVVAEVGAAEGRLQATLAELRGTYVEKALRPEGEAPRTLADFVHDANVQGLLDDIRGNVGAAEDEMVGFADAAEALARELRSVDELLRATDGPEVLDSALGEDEDEENDPGGGDDIPPVPSLLQSMDEHAADMAANLSSLVAHFDLCVSALKHTEGAGAAGAAKLDQLPDGVDADALRAATNDATPAPTEPESLTDQERADMLAVVATDAAEVDAVVADIRASAAEIESLAALIKIRGQRLTGAHSTTIRLVQALEAAGQHLPAAPERTRTFAAAMAAHAAAVQEKGAELTGLRAFYAGFLRAYDALLLEVGRRQDSSRRTRRGSGTGFGRRWGTGCRSICGRG